MSYSAGVDKVQYGNSVNGFQFEIPACADRHTMNAFRCLSCRDSGGVQKEAFFHKVLCVTMRTETEWVELVEAGWNLIAGLEPQNIIKCVETILQKDPASLPYPDLFGSGMAGKNIVNELVNWEKTSKISV